MASKSSNTHAKRPRPTLKSLANLIPNEQRTPEQRRANASKAGKASQAKRIQEKSISQLCKEFLTTEHEVKSARGKIIKMSGQEIVTEALIGNTRAHGTSASVSMIDKIKEYTEGNQNARAGAADDLNVLNGLMGIPSPNETSGDKTEENEE